MKVTKRNHKSSEASSVALKFRGKISQSIHANKSNGRNENEYHDFLMFTLEKLKIISIEKIYPNLDYPSNVVLNGLTDSRRINLWLNSRFNYKVDEIYVYIA